MPGPSSTWAREKPPEFDEAGRSSHQLRPSGSQKAAKLAQVLVEEGRLRNLSINHVPTTKYYEVLDRPGTAGTEILRSEE